MNSEIPQDPINIQADLRKPKENKKKLKVVERTLLVSSPTRPRVDDPNRLAIEALLDEHGAQGKAVATLMACLDAKRTYYDIYSKTMVEEPDYATRQSASRTLLEYKVGKPIVRQQILVGTVDSLEDVEKKLASSPAMREQFKKLIAAAELQAQIPEVKQ